MVDDPKLKNEYAAWFILLGFECSPDDITQKLGVEPTETRLKGEMREIGEGKHRREKENIENAWILRSELPRNTPIEKHIENLLNKIAPHKQNFIDVAKSYVFQFNCAIYYYEANPGILLSPTILKKAGELNIPLSFDIYCLAE